MDKELLTQSPFVKAYGLQRAVGPPSHPPHHLTFPSWEPAWPHELLLNPGAQSRAPSQQDKLSLSPGSAVTLASAPGTSLGDVVPEGVEAEAPAR